MGRDGEKRRVKTWPERRAERRVAEMPVTRASRDGKNNAQAAEKEAAMQELNGVAMKEERSNGVTITATATP